MEADERAMRLFQAIANSIHSSVEMEIDCPSHQRDGKLPILDLKVWIEKTGQDQQRNRSGSVILHEFYSKEVASKSVVNARSALSWSCKRTVLTQEVLRMLLNCSSKLPWDITASHVSDMMLRMQYSGYDQQFRAEVVRSALKAYGAIVEKDACGEEPMYRPRGWRGEERARKKREKKEAWYKKGGCESVIFVPAAPRSELKRRYEEEIKKTRYSIKVVEQSGLTLKNHLQRSNPFANKRCRRKECMVCCTDGRGQCNATGVTYELVCKECRDQYIGETARSAYSKGKEHFRSMEPEEEGSVMCRHADEKHEGAVPRFTMNVTRVFPNDALLRQITESVFINKVAEGKFINNKTEWNHVSLPRVGVVV